MVHNVNNQRWSKITRYSQSQQVDLVFILLSKRFFVRLTDFDQRFVSISGPCDFQNGLCGLRNDVNSEFQWTTGIGPTPTDNTGPSFDHTTLSNEGNTQFIQSLEMIWKPSNGLEKKYRN